MDKIYSIIFLMLVIGCKAHTNTKIQCSNSNTNLKDTKTRIEEKQNFFINELVKKAYQQIENKDYNLAKAYLEGAYDLSPEHQKVQKLYSRIRQIFPNYSVPIKGCIWKAEFDKDLALQDIDKMYLQGMKYFKEKKYIAAKEKFTNILDILRYVPKKWSLQFQSLRKKISSIHNRTQKMLEYKNKVSVPKE